MPLNFPAASEQAISKRSKAGYQRNNGRWEARYRPQSRYELKRDKVTSVAFKGFRNGLYKYEFLEYFDTAEEKDDWLTSMKADFNRRKREVDPSSASYDHSNASESAPVMGTASKKGNSKRSTSSHVAEDSEGSDGEYRPKKRSDYRSDRRAAAAAAAAAAALDNQAAGGQSGHGAYSIASSPGHKQTDLNNWKNKVPFGHGCNVLSAQLMWYCDSCQTCSPSRDGALCCTPAPSSSFVSAAAAVPKACASLAAGRAIINSAIPFQSPSFHEGRWLSNQRPFGAPLGGTMNSTASSMQTSPDKDDLLIDGLVKYMIQTTNGADEVDLIEEQQPQKVSAVI